MSDPFADERLQFYLRNRDDIKAWAAIEREVIAATRDLLELSLVAIDDLMRSIDQDAVVGRHDSGQWERVVVRHASWPATVGLALEWHRSPDPLGGNRPKLGVFWWADPASLIEPRKQLLNLVDRTALIALGYRVPLDGVWPAGQYATATADWWRDPDAWVAGLVALLGQTWPLVAPQIETLVGHWQASDG